MKVPFPQSLHLALSGLSPLKIAAISYLLIAGVGAVDYLTGFEFAFSVFYVVPVGISAWYSGKRYAAVVCVASAIVWLTADLTSGHVYSHPVFLYWNALVRYGFFVIIAQILGALHHTLDSISDLAQKDGLTGLFNGQTFRERFDFLAKVAARHDHLMSLCFIDLDGFKTINDSMGHDVGDTVLQAVANVISTRLRATDVFARLGGDEFAILLPETDLAGARAIFSDILQSLIAHAGRSNWPVGFSLGVVVISPGMADHTKALILADEAMYKAKARGTNNIFFTECAAQSSD